MADLDQHSGKNKTQSGHTPNIFRRQNGNQPAASSPALRHVPSLFVNRILSNRKAHDGVSPSPTRSSTHSTGSIDSLAVVDTPVEGAVRTEALPTNHEQAMSAGDDASIPHRSNSLMNNPARVSMLKEIRTKVPKLKIHGRKSNQQSLQPLANSQHRERSGSFGSGDNVSQKSGLSADCQSTDTSGGRDGDEANSSSALAADETDSQERMQLQIKQCEEKLRVAKKELADLREAYLEGLSSETTSSEGLHTSPTGVPSADSQRKKLIFENTNKRYKADEIKLTERIAKYEDKLNKLVERNMAGDYGMMQGVKEHVSHLRKSVKSGLAQAQGGLHVPSFGKIFGSNSNISDDSPPPGDCSPPRSAVPVDINWDIHVTEVQEIRSKTQSLEDSVQQLELRLGEAGDGQEKLDDSFAHLTADFKRLLTDQKDIRIQLSATQGRVSRLEAEMNEMANRIETQAEDALLRLQNAQLQMSERCQEIDETVEKCEARVSELEHHGQQALTINDVTDVRTSGAVVSLVNTMIAVLYTLLSYWLRVQRCLPPPLVQGLPYVVLLFVGLLFAWFVQF